MKEQHYSIRANRYNEDRFLIKNNLFAVIDGASGLTTEQKKGVGTNASRLAGFVKQELFKFKGDNFIAFLKDLSINALNNGHDTNSSCGISAVIVSDINVYLYAVGDCSILVQDKKNSVRTFKQNELCKLDKIALNQMIDISKNKNITIKQAREHINDVLIKHRLLKNMPNGYSIFCPSKNPNFVVDHYTLNKKDIKSIIICTDGFSQCYEKLNIFDNQKQLFSKKLSLKEICKKIKQVSKSDKDFNKYPRFKLFDDTTAIKLDF